MAQAPMSLAATLNAGSRVFQRHFRPLVLLSAITYLPLVIVGFFIARESMPLVVGVEDGKILVGSEAALERLGLVMIGVAFLVLVGTLFSMASLHYAVADAYLDEACDWRSSLRRSISRLPTILLTGVIVLIACAALVVIGMIAVSVGGIVAFVAIVAMVVALFMLMVLATFAIPVAVREDLSAERILPRAWELMRGRWLPTIGLLFLLALIVGLVTKFLGAGIQGGVGAGATTVDRVLLAAFLGQAIPSVLFTPLSVAVLTVAYFEMRRHRGEDIGDDADGVPSMPPPLVSDGRHQPPALAAATPGAELPEWWPAQPAGGVRGTTQDLRAHGPGAPASSSHASADPAVATLVSAPAVPQHVPSPPPLPATEDELIGMLMLPDEHLGMASPSPVPKATAASELPSSPHDDAPPVVRARWSEPLEL